LSEPEELIGAILGHLRSALAEIEVLSEELEESEGVTAEAAQ
jgi:type I restriction enzyme M protein